MLHWHCFFQQASATHLQQLSAKVAAVRWKAENWGKAHLLTRLLPDGEARLNPPPELARARGSSWETR